MNDIRNLYNNCPFSSFYMRKVFDKIVIIHETARPHLFSVTTCLIVKIVVQILQDRIGCNTYHIHKLF